MITAAAPSLSLRHIPAQPHASFPNSPRQRIGAALVAILVFVNEAVFRNADVEHVAFDWQIALRLAVCGACGLYGLAHSAAHCRR